MITTRENFERDFQGLSTEEIGDKLDREFEEDEALRRETFGEENDGNPVDYDEQAGEEDMYEQTEDPLAGDVEPTGGHPSPGIHPYDAQRLEVMRQHGDYTG